MSGNPNGVPKGRAQELTRLREELELAVLRRTQWTRVAKVLDAMFTKAEEGDVRAAKLVLEYTLSKPKSVQEQESKAAPRYEFVVMVATPQHENPPIDGESQPVEVPHEQTEP